MSIERIETYIKNAFKKEQDSYPRRVEVEKEEARDENVVVYYLVFENEIRMEYYDYGDSALCLLIPNGFIDFDYLVAEKEKGCWSFFKQQERKSLFEIDTAFYKALSALL